MGKQYKELRDNDIEFINKQKLFYLASSSGKEVNLSPKAYNCIKVLDSKNLLFLNYPGSGNRTYTDAVNNGEFTLVFNSFEEKPMILRLFCKAKIIKTKSKEFYNYLDMFNEKDSYVRDIFIFTIYAVESSCGFTVPFMEYKGERKQLKEWLVKMDKSNKLEDYKIKHFTPPNLDNI